MEWTEITALHESETRYRELVDTRKVDRFDPSSEEIRQLVRQYRGLPEQQLTVLVASDPLIFGMGRMAQALAEFIGKPFAVCSTLDEACERLEIDPSVLDEPQPD